MMNLFPQIRRFLKKAAGSFSCALAFPSTLVAPGRPAVFEARYRIRAAPLFQEQPLR